MLETGATGAGARPFLKKVTGDRRQAPLEGDITSKFGTKSAALKADPMKLLIGFGQSDATMTDVECMDAETYLVLVLSCGNHSIETLDDLRYQMYHQ